YRFLNWPSLNHFIRPRQHVGRNREADLLGGLQIDDELEFYRLLHGKIGRFSALENLIDIRGGAPEQVGHARAVGYEPPVFHIFWPVVYRREPAFYREVCNLSSLRKEDGR